MGLRCLFGHRGEKGVFNAGIVVGQCARCGRATIKRPGGRWYGLPRQVVVRWGPAGEAGLPARKALYLAHRQAPFTHKLPRRARAWDGYYN